ncbi:MAG: hypothetical protein N2049_04915 [Anaerolineales bacterium]|nr:hypothetical protein [Anaerolineales bacterium]
MLGAKRLLQILDRVLASALLIILAISASTVTTPRTLYEKARQFTRLVEFEPLGWTLDALGVKLIQSALDTPFYFSPETQKTIVQDYLQLIDEILQNEYRLQMLYGDPSVSDPLAASEEQRAHLHRLYDRQKQLAPLAEAVLEAQISALLEGLDLTVVGQPIPPVLFHISPLPYHLVISPRDKIQREASIALLPDLPLEEQIALEEKVAAALDVSTLVVPVGGIGAYPTMVMRTTSLDWLADTIAHEWIHNWLSLRPLGLHYESSPELRTMNETTASIAGREIATLFMQRYYPEWSSVRTSPIHYRAAPVPPGGWPRPAFDFRAEMYVTRVRVDELLAQGKIEEAEAYMEARRQIFWENGYLIRKLNQAYFAFYGAYADQPGGAAGEDPVGPAVRALRAQSASLAEFLKTIAAMSSFEELQRAIRP